MIQLIEKYLKIISLGSLIVYLFGFIIYNWHLSSYDIIDTSFIDSKYLIAGIHYLIIIILVISPMRYFNSSEGERKLKRISKLIASSITGAGLLYFYLNFIYISDIYLITIHWAYSWIFVLLSNHLFFYWKGKDTFWSNSILYLFGLVLLPLILFGSTFKYIKNSLGGGEPYRCVLLIDKQANISLNNLQYKNIDTLTIVHEDEKSIYFKDNSNTKSISKDFLIGKIFLNEVQ